MEVIPAIDLRNGKCVRLYQGDYGKETVFSDDPVSMALRWQSEGAQRLHLIDLDGAAKGKPCNLDAIKSIIAAVKIPVQVGGGIRSIETIEQLLSIGVGRVILGTVAVEKPELVKKACKKYSEQIIVSIDAKDRRVATRGWLEKSQVTASELATQMVDLGVRRIIYTDISRDGTLTSPNFAAIEELLSQVNVPIIAAGGISSIEHLTRLSRLGWEGAIVGKAIYTGDINLKEALKTMSRKKAPKGLNLEMVKFDEKGLIPAIAQDAKTGEVLMVAYMNREALEKTLSTGQAWFYSRSRKELWNKGATSGNYLYVKKIFIDCDEDTLLLKVDAAGPACHTGNRSCFFRELGGLSIKSKDALQR
jgi:phosphoribosylformimino-5-aminoimidazole carboxamide ribotide isomerase